MKVGGELVGHSSCEQRLSAAGQAMHQDALRRRHAETLENLGMGERQLDHFADLGDFPLHAAKLIVGDNVFCRQLRSCRMSPHGRNPQRATYPDG